MTTDGGGLTRQEFSRLLDRLGPTLAAWPAADRVAAERLVAVDDDARAMLRAARSVDAALHALMQGEPAPIGLRRAAPRPAPTPSWQRLAGFGMAALAASLAIGFVVGTVLPATDDDDGTAAVYMAVNDTDLGGVL